MLYLIRLNKFSFLKKIKELYFDKNTQKCECNYSIKSRKQTLK